MANYKRGYPRTSARSGRNSRGYWLAHWPRWHDIVFHTRPRRREETRLLSKVMHDGDPDMIAWPVSKKPHIYYW